MFTETSFRHELILAIVMLPAAWLCPGLSLLWRTLLTLLWLAMPLTECINTAIESIVDLASPAIHPLAKRAKDLGSAAVFLTILANLFAWSVAIWIVISHVMQH